MPQLTKQMFKGSRIKIVLFTSFIYGSVKSISIKNIGGKYFEESHCKTVAK